MFRKGDSEIIRGFVIQIAPWSNPTGSCLSVRKGAMKGEGGDLRNKCFYVAGTQLHGC